MAQPKNEWTTLPRSYYDVLSNRMGLQLTRTIWFELQFRLRKIFLKRRFAKSKASRISERGGYVVIENFLTPEQYDKLKKHYYGILENSEIPTNEGPKLVAPNLCNPKNGKVDSVVKELFVENDKLNDIIGNCSAHSQNILPLIRLHHYWIDPEDVGKREAARTDELHYDVPLKNMRGFFYVEDCDRTNAAFEYALGTHSFSLKRLYMEYVNSLVQSRVREGKPYARVQPIRDDLKKLLDAKPIPIEAKGNSLIIFNTMGLHRRGRFQFSGKCEAILLDYRYLDTDANYKSYQAPIKWLMRQSRNRS